MISSYSREKQENQFKNLNLLIEYKFEVCFY